MGSATLHINELGGYSAPARCYRIDPPRVIDGTAHEYVTVWIEPEMPHVGAQVCTVVAGETGAVAGSSVRRRSGSFTIDADPSTPEEVESCYVRALARFGDGYQIVAAPEPEPEQPEGE